MKAKTALVLHYNPVKLYPPAESGIRFLQQSGFAVKVITTQVFGVQTDSKLSLLFRILSFNLRALWCIALKSIDLLVVYEHYSVIPIRPCLYLHPRCKIWLHFHEYSSPEEVKEGGIYSRHCWTHVAHVINDVSLYTHTNTWRLNQFQKDFECDTPCIEKGRYIPNTPPQNWIKRAASKRKEVQRKEGPLRLVYHGAVHSSTTYVVELYRILSSAPGKYRLDIYSRDEIVEGYNEDVHWHDPIPFDDLADVLPTYDVGLILYKGHIPNYVHNVPNKFWEYRAAGLGVMMPAKMSFNLVPKSLRNGTAIFDFVGWSSQEFDGEIKALMRRNGHHPSVQSIEFHLHQILETMSVDEVIGEKG
jgi:hypothetical protein